MKKQDLRSMKQGAAQNAISGIDPAAVQQVRRAVQQYDGHNEDELVQELFRTAQSQRAAGKLDNAQIEGLTNMLSPMLNAQQRQQMQALVEQLKNT